MLRDNPPMIERAYRMRTYPNRVQAMQLARLGGACRFVWNWALARRTEAYRADGMRLNWIALSREFTELKTQPATAWLAELPREPFQQVLRDQERAFSNFFAKRASYPRFKSRGSKVSMRFTLNQRHEQVARGDGRWAKVKLPGLGRLKLRRTEALDGRLRNVTLNRNAAGHWYAMLSADRVQGPLQTEPERNAVGIDVGVGAVAVLSDGRRFAASRELEAQQRRLRRYQRRYMRQRNAAARTHGLDPSKPLPKGTRLPVSNRARRTQRRIGKLHVRTAAIRQHGLHAISTTVVREHAVIAVENIDLKALARSGYYRAFRRRFGSASPGELRRQIDYKAAWHGRKVVEVGAFYPSSKFCSTCGHKLAALRLAVRRWTCPACNAIHDRDHNAAKNIRAEGLRILAISTPATGEGPGSDARGVCDAGSHSPAGTKNRELNSRSVRARPRKARLERAAAGSG
jgi:putative transposase